MKGLFRKIDEKTLVAVSPEGMEALAAIHRGKDCMGDIRGARNVQQHRLFWALMGLVAEQTDSSKEACKEWVLKKLKYVDFYWLPNGEMTIRTQSIAFESMEQAKFAEMFNLAIPAIASLLETAPKDVIRRFNDMLDPDARRHFKKILKYVPSPPVQASDTPVEGVRQTANQEKAHVDP